MLLLTSISTSIEIKIRFLIRYAQCTCKLCKKMSCRNFPDLRPGSVFREHVQVLVSSSRNRNVYCVISQLIMFRRKLTALGHQEPNSFKVEGKVYFHRVTYPKHSLYARIIKVASVSSSSLLSAVRFYFPVVYWPSLAKQIWMKWLCLTYYCGIVTWISSRFGYFMSPATYQ